MPPLFAPPPVNLVMPGEFTVATLPPAEEMIRRYVWLTDLHDGQPDYVISDGQFWKPVRPLAARTVPNANSNMTLQVLVNSPTQILRGALTAQRTLTTNIQGAYIGARFRIKREATGLFGMVLSGVLGSPNIGVGTWADLEYTSEGWVQTASGGIL